MLSQFHQMEENIASHLLYYKLLSFKWIDTELVSANNFPVGNFRLTLKTRFDGRLKIDKHKTSFLKNWCKYQQKDVIFVALDLKISNIVISWNKWKPWLHDDTQRALSRIKVNYFLVPLRAGFDAEQTAWISDRGSASMGVLILPVNAIARTFVDWDFSWHDVSARDKPCTSLNNEQVPQKLAILVHQSVVPLSINSSTLSHDWNELDTYLPYPSYICDKF